jgi:hypothetical protein
MTKPTATSNNPMNISDRPSPLKKKPRAIQETSNTSILPGKHYAGTDSFSELKVDMCVCSISKAIMLIDQVVTACGASGI